MNEYTNETLDLIRAFAQKVYSLGLDNEKYQRGWIISPHLWRVYEGFLVFGLTREEMRMKT